MAAVDLTDFQDIYEAVLEELKIPATDTTTLARVKRNINEVYVNEIAPFARWPWLRKRKDIVHQKYYNTGTATVTEDSATVTISSSITASKAGYFFALDGYSEIYLISAHTAATATLTLSSAYTGVSGSALSYKIWTDRVALPINYRETEDMKHDWMSRPMTGVGSQKLDELSQPDFRMEDRPRYYSTDDFLDPSTSADTETESDRYRQVRIWPALYNRNTTLHVTAIQEVTALDAAGDEPLMPIEDRIVLKYGALKQSWIRERNLETAQENERKYKEKLAAMVGRYEDSTDHPRIEMDAQYITAKRTPTIGRRSL